MVATLKTIADIVGVSVPVVAKVLNSTKSTARVSLATADRIREVSVRLKYQRNFAAAAMVQKSTRLIGVHIQEGASGGVSGPFESAFLRGVASVCEVSGHDILLVSIPSPLAVSHSLLHLRQRRIDGLLIVLTQHEQECLAPFARFSDRVLIAGGHVVPEGMKSIQLKNSEAARIAYRHLQQMGHERIGFIGSCVLPEMIDSVQRWEGFCEACGPSARDWAYYLGNASPAIGIGEDYCFLEGVRGVRFLMSRPPPLRPTAIIAHNDQVAMAAIMEMNRLKISVPGEVSIMGIGNESLSRLGIPSISTVSLPFRSFGVEAAIKLLRQIAPTALFPKNLPEAGSLKPLLLVRESTASRGKQTGCCEMRTSQDQKTN